jgi:hypothetical protein
MKKNTLLLAMLTTLPALGQQVIVKDMPEYMDELNVIPAQFTINNVPILHIEQGDDYEYDEEEYTIALYNDDIEKIAEVRPISHSFDYTLTYQTQTREVKEVIKEEIYREEMRRLEEWYTLKDFINDYFWGGADVEVVDGDTIILPRETRNIETRGIYDHAYFGYEYFGTKYPFEYYLCKDNVIYRIRAEYFATYTDWSPASERTENESCELPVLSIYYHDFDAQAESNRFTLSQTLFNSDDKFEYIIPKMVLTDISNYITSVPSMGNSLVLTKSELVSDYAYPTCKGLQVVSSDGTILHDINFTDGFYMENGEYDGFDIYGITIGGKDYLIVKGYMESEDDDEEDNSCALFYRINRETSSLQEVKSLPVKMRVKPQASTINVQLSANTSEASEIIMTNASGATVARKYIPAGECTATFKTSLPKGVYNITRFQNGKNIENGKVMMK